MTIKPLNLVAGLLLATFAVGTVRGQTNIVSDDYNVTTTTTGFALNNGLNFNINPPLSTRLTGTAASSLRYLQTATGKPATVYGINSSRARIQTDSGIGRYTLSGNGSTAFDFSTALGTLGASPTNPAVYQIRIKMRNDATSTARFSFGIGTVEGDAGTWDFGVQLYRAGGSDTFYTVQKRIDIGSSGTADINAVMGTTPASSYGTFISFLIEVTDAGAESTAFSSRVRVSQDNGATWFYDTQADTGTLPNGWRFDGGARVFLWDQAGNASGNVFYDDFSVTWISGPPLPAPGNTQTWTGGGADNNWSTPANWNGVTPTNGDFLVFNGVTRQVNTNDLIGLSVPLVTFNNGGFALYGNLFTNSSTISNVAGINIIGADLAWTSSDNKFWNIVSGSELQLNNNTSVETGGDHLLFGGGTLRVKGNMGIGVNTTANPAFVISEGKQVVDGGTFSSRGGYRIGSLATGAGAQTIVTNGGTLSLTASGANLRVGDSANPVTARLNVNGGTVSMSGGSLAVPYAAGATGQVAIVGGSTVSGTIVNFSQNGAGFGTIGVTNSALEAIQIKKTTAAGVSQIYFDNGTLRTASSASNSFFSGVDLAEIESGGLVIDAQTDATIGQLLTGAGPLVKSNSAVVTLTAANTYSGNTTVKQGKLVLPTLQTNAAGIQVDSGAELGVLLQGVGTSLSANNLSFSADSRLSFDLASFGTPNAPLLKVTSLSAGGQVKISIANGLQLNTGQIVLVDYSGAISGGFGNFVLDTLPSGMSATLVNNVANSSIDLNITGVPGLRWTGATSGDWDGATQNWVSKQNNLPTTYSDGLPVEFLDGASNPFINVAASVGPSSILVSNNTLPYVWNWPGGGAITVGLIKKFGSSSITRVETSADTVGGIEINGGAFIASNAVDSTFTTVLTDVTPGGAFVKAGGSIMTLSSTNTTYDGAVVVAQGRLKMANASALGTTNGGTFIASGATLDLNDQVFPHEPVTVGGDGDGGIGAIYDSASGGAVANNLTDVTLTNNTSFGGPSGSRWDIRARAATGPDTGLKGNGFNLTKVGDGFVSIACQRNIGALTPYWNMNLGDVTINGGTLALAESLTLGNPAKLITINSGATLQLFDLNVTNPLPRNIVVNDGKFTFSGGTADTNILTGTVTISGSIGARADQAYAAFNGPIVGSGSMNLSAVDPGRIFFNAANTFSGDTTVTNGTFGGSGSITGNLIMLGGTNSPGLGVGTFTVGGSATLAGTTLMELNRNLSPTSDRLVVNGTLTFGGVLQVVLGAGAPTPQSGDVYQLFNKGSGSSFTSVSLPALSSGLSWATTNLTVNGTISVVGNAANPTIGAVTRSGNNFIFSGTGGVQGNTYTVLASTNVALPRSSWTPVVTNTFGAGGIFSFTNAIDPTFPTRFFILRTP